jgi:hypothetical protein
MAIYIIRGFLHPCKKRPDMLSEGNATHPVGCDRPLKIVMGLSHPTRSLSRIVCKGQERPKGRKGTLRPDIQANTRPRIFFKANFTIRYRKTVVRKEDNLKIIGPEYS